jgi:hypothetical protein
MYMFLASGGANFIRMPCGLALLPLLGPVALPLCMTLSLIALVVFLTSVVTVYLAYWYWQPGPADWDLRSRGKCGGNGKKL